MLLVKLLHLKMPFNRMKLRHEIWKKKYPDWPATRGPAFQGLANARPETKALSVPPVRLRKLPFDPLEYIEYDPPFDRNAVTEKHWKATPVGRYFTSMFSDKRYHYQGSGRCYYLMGEAMGTSLGNLLPND